MDKALQISLDQIVPFSKARANLSSLIEVVKRKKYVVISKKYQPTVALVNLDFLAKILKIYQDWQRYQAFEVVEQVRAKSLNRKPKEVERDIAEAIAAVRAGWEPKK